MLLSVARIHSGTRTRISSNAASPAVWTRTDTKSTNPRTTHFLSCLVTVTGQFTSCQFGMVSFHKHGRNTNVSLLRPKLIRCPSRMLLQSMQASPPRIATCSVRPNRDRCRAPPQDEVGRRAQKCGARCYRFLLKATLSCPSSSREMQYSISISVSILCSPSMRLVESFDRSRPHKRPDWAVHISSSQLSNSLVKDAKR